ncbi:hypothetical protein [Streptomyces sp. NPDC005141]
MKENTQTPNGVDEWADRVQDLSKTPDSQAAKKMVADIYRTAQDELDAQRAQAEFEREE